MNGSAWPGERAESSAWGIVRVMASAKALLGAALGRFLFREATVTRVTPLGARFRLVELEGAALRGVTWTPGDKVQVFLDGVGFRTYTPMAWDAAAGTTRLLVYVHDAAYPGAGWGRSLVVGARCRLFGPRGSIDFPALGGGVTLVGDETSFAAAAALGKDRAERVVLEVNGDHDPAEAVTVLGVPVTLVRRAPDDAHLAEVARSLEKAAPIVLTGRAQMIQALRARGLKAAKTKAYWSVGKSGLD